MQNKPILLLNGPNLNMLGKRDQNIYGSKTLEDIEAECSKYAFENGYYLQALSSNYEGKLVDWIQNSIDNISGLIINPGGLAHTSIVLRDALELIDVPKIEIHISDIYKREKFRQVSLTAEVMNKVITGKGTDGYLDALKNIIKIHKKKTES